MQGVSVEVMRQLLEPPGEVSDDAQLEAALWAALPAGCAGAWQVHAQRAESQVLHSRHTCVWNQTCGLDPVPVPYSDASTRGGHREGARL